MTDAANFLRRCGLFRDFDDKSLDSISQSAEEITADGGTDIVRENEAGDAMYVVLAGEVQVYTRNAEGREITLARLGPGEHFGEQSLLPGGTGRRYASVRAVELVRLAHIPRHAFQSVLAADDALHERLVEIGEEQIRGYLQQLSPVARAINLNAVGRLRRNLAPGEVLFHQGDEADALYFVNVGRLSVWHEENGERTLVGYVERPGCVGELALMMKDRRSQTVIAEDYAEVTGVFRTAFDEVYSESSSFRDYLATLQRGYELPQRGILTQHNGTFAGHECVTTLYHLNDGRVFAAYRVVGQSLYALECVDASAAETLTWQRDAQSRELRLDANGTVIGLTARGEWPDVQTYHLFVLDGGKIGPAEHRQFLDTGSFDFQRADTESDVICNCVNVTEATLRAAIRQGATTFTRLQESTGCGSVCGGCVPVITEMLGSEEWVLADVVAERDESPGIRSLELVPRDPSYPESDPGQHIVVEGLINGLRIRRPYTLSSGRRHGGRLRITVKLEPGGAFSPWLFNGRPQGEPLRITRPRGDNVIDLSKGTVVCLVAGVGVTPALAAAATVAGAGPQHGTPLVIHYSARSRERMACLDELESAARRVPIELIVRDTSVQGRLDAAEIAKLAARFPGANWYLCGPEGYVSDVGRSLRVVQISDDRIHVERFTPVGTPIAANDERETFRRYVLVSPKPAQTTLAAKAFRRLGKTLNSAANTAVNPLRWIEHRFARKAELDPALPLEYLCIVSALSWGPYQYQMQAFNRLSARGSANRKQAREAKVQGRQIPENTADGDTFTYWVPAPPFPTFPAAQRVDTGWTRVSDRSFVPAYVTRSRAAIEQLLRKTDHADRGALPFHFFQQIFGRVNTPSCPARKGAGLFGGQINDNTTWTEDRAFATELFGFPAINDFGTSMHIAAEQTCAAIDQVIEREGNRVIDLNVMLSKVAYTIIVRAVFGNVDLAEMHDLGRTLSESIRKALDYLWEFVLGRRSIPSDYVKTIEGARLTIRRMIDLIRELDRTGRLTEAQRAAPVVRLILDTAGEPGGAHDRLYTLILPIVIGGHETTGHTMTWSFYEMARDRALEAEVFTEIEAFQSTHGGRAVLTSDYDERPAAWALLAETLRRHSPLPATSRNTLHAGTVPPDRETGIGGFSYPHDAMVVFSILGIHLDPARWEDPYAFRIQRWFDGAGADTSRVEKGKIVRANIRAREQALDWLPFSDGPGRCAGAHFNAHEFFIILDALLPRYRFELANPGEEVPYNEGIVRGPEKGRIGVRIRPRN